ncbi:MAG: ABC transporter ATP-binding protein, partial [Oscillospiraceae bacterium]|nr:ABC transporter ATP-binding protein [Oscillospiraceae bacterium]
MEQENLAISIRGLKKKYTLGQINGTTLQNELKRLHARRRGLDDPDSVIGQEQRLVGQTFMALNGIDLTVHKGEALGIIGKNGAGKSTLLKLLSQITAPTEGTLDINGRITSMLEVGTGFNGEMTGRENVYLNGAILGMTRAEIDAKLDDIIAFSEVGDFIDTPVKRYSSGMFVKLAFSVAAHLDSEILIMDEVLAVGDVDFQQKCLKRMREAARVEGRTILYVSHNMTTIRTLCDRCILMADGKIVYDGDVDTAVSLYLGTKESERTVFRYGPAYRPYDKVLRANLRFEMLELSFAPGCTPTFSSRQKQSFLLRFHALQPFQQLGFRLELWFQDG